MTNNFKEEYDGSLDSKYYFSSGKVGAPTSIQSPNQIGELTSRLNIGLKAVELGALNQSILDQVPKEHFDEVRRLNKLTGAQASLHAPIQDLDLAGFTQKGWDEFERKSNVIKLGSVLDRAHQMDPEGNTPVTVHAGSMFAQRWQKEGLETEEGKPARDARSEMVIVNQDTGEVQLTKYKKKKYFGGEEKVWTPEKLMENLNENEWDRQQLQIMQWKKSMNEVQDRLAEHLSSPKINIPALEYARKHGIATPEQLKQLENVQQELRYAEDFTQESYRNIRSLIEDMQDVSRKFADKKSQDYIYFKKEVEPEIKKAFEKGEKEIEQKAKERYRIFQQFQKAKTKKESAELGEKFQKAQQEFINSYSNQTENMSKFMSRMPTPKTWAPVDEFSKKQVSDSVSEAAITSWKKHGDKSPLILLENFSPEASLSRADALRKAVEESRKKFAKKLVKEEKISEKKAKEAAEKLIGVTWDTGHINMLKKYGYSDEDILEETKKIAPFVKHAHLADNFGFEDSHLPPGLGEANIKEQLKALEKAGFKGRGIVEAGEFVATFKEVPHLYALSHLESPLYVEKTGPYWKEIWDTFGTYTTGFGEIMPQKYFDLYGPPGWGQLPAALGGSARTPERGRFAEEAT